MEEFKAWFKRFANWVRYEPVRAAESVRVLLYSVTGMLALGPGVDELITQIMGVVTALFSIYASRLTRNKVSPVAKFDDVIDTTPVEAPEILADFDDEEEEIADV